MAKVTNCDTNETCNRRKTVKYDNEGHETNQVDDESGGEGGENEERNDIEKSPVVILPPPPCWFQFDNDDNDNIDADNGDKEGVIDTDGNVSSSLDKNDDNAILSFFQRKKEESKEEDMVDAAKVIHDVDNEDENCADQEDDDQIAAVPCLVKSKSSEEGNFVDAVEDINRNFNNENVKECNSPEKSQQQNSQQQYPSKLNSSPTQLSHSNSKITWKETTTQVLPVAARELISSSLRRAYHHTRVSYASSTLFGKQTLRHSELGNHAGGYHRSLLTERGIRDVQTGKILWHGGIGAGGSGGAGVYVYGASDDNNAGGSFEIKEGTGWEDEWDKVRVSLPPFSSLPWVDRQLVEEWRTCDYSTEYSKEHQKTRIKNNNDNDSHGCAPDAVSDGENDEISDKEEYEFQQARALVPQPLPRPPRENAASCYACRQPFSATLLRHHCRLCGRSYCQPHSRWNHRLPHLGYDPTVPERVCSPCNSVLEAQNLAERIAWRMARCRDYMNTSHPALRPYFETGIDTVEDAAFRLTRAALRMARSIPLGAQATIAVETLDVLRKHGLKGVYGLILRKEFMAAADLLCKVTGINKRAWPLSVHELSAAVFYALAQHRALRGIDPEREERIHTFRREFLGGGYRDVDDSFNSDDEQKEKEETRGRSYIDSNQEFDNASRLDIVDDGGGDTIVWGRKNEESFPLARKGGNAVIDETDNYDPMAESVVDLLALADKELQQETRQSGLSSSGMRHNMGIHDEEFTGTGDNIIDNGSIDPPRTASDRFRNDDDAYNIIQHIDKHDNSNKGSKPIIGDNCMPLAPNKNQSSTYTRSYTTQRPTSCKSSSGNTYNSDSSLKNASHSSATRNFDPKTVTESTPTASQPETKNTPQKEHLPFIPVCEPVSDSLLSSLLFYCPLASSFIYATSEVDMQLLAAQQGWRLIYAHLNQNDGCHGDTMPDMPASAVFVHSQQKIACLAIRGTATINDVVTDIRAMPVQFPEGGGINDDDYGTIMGNSNNSTKSEDSIDDGKNNEYVQNSNYSALNEDDWTPVFRGQGLALCGMAGAAFNLFREHIDTLLLFARKGYRIRLAGHSLGGGVAALLGSLVRRHFELRIQNGDPLRDVWSVHVTKPAINSSNAIEGADGEICQAPGINSSATKRSLLEHTDLIRVYSYGSPACVDAKLADYAGSYVTNCVLHDDVVPRLTPTSIRGLLKHLLHIRETWVKAHLADDIMAITHRAKQGWAPRLRNGFTLLSSTSASSFKGYKKKLKAKKRLLKEKIIRNGGKNVRKSTSSSNLIHHDGCTSTEMKRRVENLMESLGLGNDSHNQPATNSSETNLDGDQDVMNDEEKVGDGVYYDGDCFYEADEILIEESDEEVEDGENEDINNKGVEQKNSDEGWVPFDEPPMDICSGNGIKSKSEGESSNTNDEKPRTESPPAVLLEETPLPRMFIPGKIVHIYTHRGGYKAAFVPRAFRELRRISLAGNMLSDHMSKSYYEALLECKSIRKAPEALPEWTGFNEESTCSCCASRFTWASTSDSEAQEARDKHNCRSCGSLVCDPCSKNRAPVPSIGIINPARVCDRCYNDMGAVLTKMGNGHALTRSFMDDDDDDECNGNHENTTKSNFRHEETRGSFKDERLQLDNGSCISAVDKKQDYRKSKRSLVVDELALRVNSSIFT